LDSKKTPNHGKKRFVPGTHALILFGEEEDGVRKGEKTPMTPKRVLRPFIRSKSDGRWEVNRLEGCQTNTHQNKKSFSANHKIPKMEKV